MKSVYSFVLFVCLSVRPPVCLLLSPHGTNGQVFIKTDIWVFLKIFRKFYHDKYRIRTTGTLHKDLYTLMIISRWILLRTINVSGKPCRENENIFFIQQLFRNPAIYEILWENAVMLERPTTDDDVTQRMRFACWITKATESTRNM